MIVIDTSALVALFKGEDEAEAIAARMDAAVEIHLSAGSLIEAYIVLSSVAKAREPGDKWLDGLISQLAIRIDPVTDGHAQLAREAYQTYGKGSGHGAALNFGDCFAYALAKAMDAPLLYKGNDFATTDIKSALSA